MKYDFDREINRKDTQSAKWGVIQNPDNPSRWHATDAYFGENRILPLWVADMDFPAPRPVVDALVRRAQHGIYGYTIRTDSYDRAVAAWMKRRHGWEIDTGWIVSTPGVVPAVNFLVQTFVEPGERVLLQRPVYYPFFNAIENNGAEIVSSSLILKDGRYEMDFDDFEKKASDPAVTFFILCSPHNPVGRVWTREELTRVGEICLKHRVLVVADEIHADLIYRGVTFTPFAGISEAMAQNTVVCTAPSKTFNLAGLHTSNIIIPNTTLRRRFQRTLDRCGMGKWANPFGVLACETAYREGEPWLEQVMAYIEGNLDFLQAFIDTQLPGVRVIRPEGTYLVWLDCRELGLDNRALKRLMLEKSRIFPDEGFIFGPEGDGFERINIACPRSILKDALTRVRKAVTG
ncbi:cystathionine beta-lyase [Desulfosarcina alkanivorans]|uniref:cysteine-S-conjugate beta-lyase n=1 Tax=Desulfosarcina alkanivorans TaxID=571177 RepID=A0A5K7YNM5_9BACT|nr:MalY/PatB family protein [Desulfosarcina alkanivorans]BBO70806.1 cystathionine beta-lyase [Desulfosarcina alkanivorans]